MKRQLQNHEALANAIIDQAIKDYVKSSVILKNSETNSKNYVKAQRIKEDVERFLASQWFGTLCGVDPEYIKTKLDERVEEYVKTHGGKIGYNHAQL